MGFFGDDGTLDKATDAIGLDFDNDRGRSNAGSNSGGGSSDDRFSVGALDDGMGNPDMRLGVTARPTGDGTSLSVNEKAADFYSKNQNTNVSYEDYLAGKTVGRVLGVVAGPVGLGVRAITELQKRGVLPRQDPKTAGEFFAEQQAMGDGGANNPALDNAVNQILDDPSKTDAQKNKEVTDILESEINKVNAEEEVARVQAMSDAAMGDQTPQSILDNPQAFLTGQGANLSQNTPQMDVNAPGTVMSDINTPPTSQYNYTPATATPAGDVAAPGQKPASVYNAAMSTGRVANIGQADAQQGQVRDEAVIDAAQGDIQGTATGRNEDGTVNEVGVALNAAQTQNISTVIDTSTVSGKLLAQELGEGNYTDAKATVQGQLETLSKQFTDPATGEPKIPSWAAGVARNVSRIAAFKGMTGTAATAAMSQAIMEASLPIAQQDAQFFQTATMQNLDNRQQMAVQKAQVLSNLQLANLDARMTAAVNNSKSFLQMDLANLDNAQQAEIVNTQARVQSILEDSKAENAARLFRAESQNDFTKFYDQLSSQIDMFNTEQRNAMERFNAGEVNDASEFNARMENQREQFYREMQYNVDLANARWRQTVETANTEMQFEAAKTDVKNIVDLTEEGLNRLWDREDAILAYAWKGQQAEKDRETQIYVADRDYDIDERRIRSEEEIAQGRAWYETIKTGVGIVDTVTGWF